MLVGSGTGSAIAASLQTSRSSTSGASNNPLDNPLALRPQTARTVATGTGSLAAQFTNLNVQFTDAWWEQEEPPIQIARML